MVMAETQKSPESVRSTKRSRAQRIRQDSAACVSLSSIYLSKSSGAKRPQTNGSALLPPRRCENEANRPVARGSLVSIRRLPAHCRTPVHGARTTLINLNHHPCQRLAQDNLCACRPGATRKRRKMASIAAHTGVRDGSIPLGGLGESRHWAFD